MDRSICLVFARCQVANDYNSKSSGVTHWKLRIAFSVIVWPNLKVLQVWSHPERGTEF